MEEDVVRPREQEPEEPAEAPRPSLLPPRAPKPAPPAAALPPREAPPTATPAREEASPLAPTQSAPDEVARPATPVSLEPARADAPLEHSLAPGEAHELPAQLAPAPPLARYEELELLGVGGAAVVRLARDRESGARVAIKRLRREAAAQAQRFWREAEAIARLDHPNVVRLLHVVAADELDAAPLALVLELVDGPTLERVVREEGPLPLAQALEVALGVARGLAHAHRQGVIHRDVKPSNVLLAPGGVPKLADFGLALPLEAQLSLTQSGGVLGTLDYMAPEQWDHPHAVDGRADVYGLGATLYRLLTGASPRVIREGRLPAAARALVLRCVEERPQERYADMDELIAALERALARALEDSSGVHEPLARVASQLGRELEEGERAGEARRLRVAALGLQALGLLSPEAVHALEAHLAVGSPLEAELPRLVAHTLAAAEARGRERPRLLADAYALLMAALARSELAPAAREALARLGADSREPVRAEPAERLAEALGRLAQEGALSALDLRRAAEAGGSTESALEGALRLLRLRGRGASEAEWRVERARWRRALDVLAAALPEPELAAALRRERLTLELEAAARRAAAAEASARAAEEPNAPGSTPAGDREE